MKWQIVRIAVPAMVLALAPTGEVGSQTEKRKCGPATIQLTSPWQPAKDPKYVASFGEFRPDFTVEPDEQWEQLGEHRTSSILEVSTEVESWCDTDTCHTCVVAITALIGFTPSEILLHEDLRRNDCARKLTWRHEEEHAAVTRRAQAMALEEARRNLAWARHRQAAHVTPESRRKTGQEEVMHRVEQDLMRALQKSVDYSERANARLDQPDRYRRESRWRWKLCRGRKHGSIRAQTTRNAISRFRARRPVPRVRPPAASWTRRYYRGRIISI